MMYGKKLRLPRVSSKNTGSIAGVLVLGTLVFVLAYAGKGILQTLKRFFADPFGLNGSSDALNEQAEAKKTLDSVGSVDTSQLTITLDKAAVIAQALYTAMHPSGFWSAANDGTDEDAIYKQFLFIKSRADMVAVLKAFGVKRYRDNLAGREDGDLLFWLNEELDGDELEKIQPKLNLI